MDLHAVKNQPLAFTATFTSRLTGQSRTFWVFDERKDGWLVSDIRSGQQVDVEPPTYTISNTEWKRE